MERAEFGVIGGSGLYQMEELENPVEVQVETPFGSPSDVFILGNMHGRKLAFLARHGRGHRLLPGELNFRANIYAFKTLGVRRILSASAVGSLKLEHKPLDFVLPDQFVDRTRGRISTFFGEGVAAHIGFADPVCGNLARRVETAGRKLGLSITLGGTYLCMEGPAFSTRAESHLYRSWGMDIIGMTNLQEAKLAREAEICYVTIAMVTDYDCWHEEEEPVTVEMLIECLTRNSQNARRLISEVVRDLAGETDCSCQSALKNAILTPMDLIPEATRENLGPIIGKYMK